MTDHTVRPPDELRLQILRASARQFARKSYSTVSLDDILADAEVTKGALYFRFPSKRALATALVKYGAVMGSEAIGEVLSRRLSGVETLIDLCYLIAINDISDETARAALNLLESLGHTDDLQAKVIATWVDKFGEIFQQGVDDGDLVSDCEPDSAARTLVSVYLGLRQTSDLADPEQFLCDLQRGWELILRGAATRDRLEYLTSFLRRRTGAALARAKPLKFGDL